MKRWNTGRVAVVLAPVVVLLVAGALYFSVMASRENYRLTDTMGRIFAVADSAQQMTIPPEMTPQRALASFLDFFKSYDSAYAGTISAVSPYTGHVENTVTNSWGEPLWVTFYPPQQMMRLETTLSPVRCQRLLMMLVSDDPSRWGLLSLDVRHVAGAPLQNVWRADRAEKPAADFVAGLCEKGEKNYVSMVFSTQPVIKKGT